MTDPTPATQASWPPAVGFTSRLGRGITWRLIVDEIAEDRLLGCRLAHNDPEPPTGTIVEDGQGRHWERCGDRWRGDEDDETSWLKLTSADMAPVRIVQAVVKGAAR